jgi:phenylacetic acid degradation operon negative regulatory protein
MADMLNKYLASQNRSGTKIRVWSLVVTIFGDVIEPRGGVCRLGALQQITEHIGIESNALRTAMSRLASDGWLERQRIGRASYYKPSPLAAREIALASDVIYRFFPPNWNGDWIFALSTNTGGFDAEVKASLHNAGFAFHSRKLAIAPDMGDSDQYGEIQEISIFNASSKNTANMLTSINFHHDCETLYLEFSKSASQLLENVKNQPEINGLDALLLRSLLVHQWRRIVLRDVHWPQQLRRHDWPGFSAQSMIGELYHRLLDPSEKWLSCLDATADGKLPEAASDLSFRFLL